MIAYDKIQIKIAEAIEQSCLTQKEIGKRIGITQSTVSQYCIGRFKPLLDVFAKLCEVLDLDANEILCVSEY